jgi:hypothetical protein
MRAVWQGVRDVSLRGLSAEAQRGPEAIPRYVQRGELMRVGQNRKRDANEAEIVSALRKVGASVIRISEKGAPDLLVFHRGAVHLLEVKSRLGGATTAQDATSAQGWPVVTVRTVDDGLRAVGAIR